MTNHHLPPGLVGDLWFGVLAPPATPDAVTSRIAGEITARRPRPS